MVCSAVGLDWMTGISSVSILRSSVLVGRPGVMTTCDTPVTAEVSIEARESTRTGVCSCSSSRTRTAAGLSGASSMPVTVPTFNPANSTCEETERPATSGK